MIAVKQGRSVYSWDNLSQKPSLRSVHAVKDRFGKLHSLEDYKKALMDLRCQRARIAQCAEMNPLRTTILSLLDAEITEREEKLVNLNWR